MTLPKRPGTLSRKAAEPVRLLSFSPGPLRSARRFFGERLSGFFRLLADAAGAVSLVGNRDSGEPGRYRSISTREILQTFFPCEPGWHENTGSRAPFQLNMPAAKSCIHSGIQHGRVDGDSPEESQRKMRIPMNRSYLHASTMLSPLNLALVVASMPVVHAASAQRMGAPQGFTALFNGNDLSGWRGGDTFDHRAWLAMPEQERRAKSAEWTADMKKHWRVENDELVNDGDGKYATTEKDYGDFELLLEYKTVAKADSGIYLRGVPQVQIWDYTDAAKFPLGAGKGSGGLWNNSAGAPGKDPLVLADRPFGEWNKFRIVMVGSRVSVWLNDKQVVDHAILENYYDKEDKTLQPQQRHPVPAQGPIQLQTHGGEIRWRNVFIREIPAEEANAILRKRDEGGFESVFNGKDFTGWAGPTDEYEIHDGAMVCKPGQAGTIYTRNVYSDFVVRLEYKLLPGGNGG